MTAEDTELIRELRAEVDGCETTIISMGEKLSAIVNITKGDPPFDTLHSTHDAVESVAALHTSQDALEKAIQGVLDAWGTLEGGAHYSPRRIEAWLQGRMAPAIQGLRDATK